MWYSIDILMLYHDEYTNAKRLLSCDKKGKSTSWTHRMLKTNLSYHASM